MPSKVKPSPHDAGRLPDTAQLPPLRHWSVERGAWWPLILEWCLRKSQPKRGRHEPSLPLTSFPIWVPCRTECSRRGIRGNFSCEVTLKQLPAWRSPMMASKREGKKRKSCLEAAWGCHQPRQVWGPFLRLVPIDPGGCPCADPSMPEVIGRRLQPAQEWV